MGALSGVYMDLSMPKDTQGPYKGSDQRWAKCVDQTFLSWSAFPGLFDHFIIALEIRTTNLICWISWTFKGLVTHAVILYF